VTRTVTVETDRRIDRKRETDRDRARDRDRERENRHIDTYPTSCDLFQNSSQSSKIKFGCLICHVSVSRHLPMSLYLG